MSIEQKIEGNIGKLFLSDEIDLDKSPIVRENIKELIDKAKTIEVQMSKVKYIDSSGIAALIEGMQLSKKSTTGKNASEETASETAPQPETEPQASENVDLSPQEDQQQSPSEVQENNPTEETQPSIKREDDGDDKIKFKR